MVNMAARRTDEWKTHTLLSGEVLELGSLNAEDREYLDELARDAGAGKPYVELLMRQQGPGAYTTRATGGMVTMAVIESLVYRVAQDIVNRAGIAQGKLGPPAAAPAASEVSVPEAATIAGMSRQNLNAAIARGALAARKVGGRYLISLEALRAYQATAGARPAPGRAVRKPPAKAKRR